MNCSLWVLWVCEFVCINVWYGCALGVFLFSFRKECVRWDMGMSSMVLMGWGRGGYKGERGEGKRRPLGYDVLMNNEKHGYQGKRQKEEDVRRDGCCWWASSGGEVWMIGLLKRCLNSIWFPQELFGWCSSVVCLFDWVKEREDFLFFVSFCFLAITPPFPFPFPFLFSLLHCHPSLSLFPLLALPPSLHHQSALLLLLLWFIHADPLPFFYFIHPLFIHTFSLSPYSLLTPPSTPTPTTLDLPQPLLFFPAH